MGIKINQYAIERLTFGDDDYYDIDYWDGATYQTAKIKGSTIKSAMSAGDTIYSADGTLSGNRIVNADGKVLQLTDVSYVKETAIIVPTAIPIGTALWNYIGNQLASYLARWHDVVSGLDRLRILNDGRLEINEEYKLPDADGGRMEVLTTDGFGNTYWGANTNGFYAQLIASSPMTTINTETSFEGAGVGSLSVPANYFGVGDSFHCKIGGVISSTGGGSPTEIIVRIKANAVTIASTGNFDLDNATAEGWEVELDFTILSVGIAGQVATNGNFAYTKTNDKKVSGHVFQDVQTIDTTIAQTLDVTGEFDNNIGGGDSIYAQNFVLYKVY
jgi:hypothetical protein